MPSAPDVSVVVPTYNRGRQLEPLLHSLLSQNTRGVTYEVVGWERVRGTARRPQEAINELIAESHFLVALFKESWGSEPGSPWGYTSGTEEERAAKPARP